MLLIVPGHGIAGAGTALTAREGDDCLIPFPGIIEMPFEALLGDRKDKVCICAAAFYPVNAERGNKNCSNDDDRESPAALLFFSILYHRNLTFYFQVTEQMLAVSNRRPK